MMDLSYDGCIRKPDLIEPRVVADYSIFPDLKMGKQISAENKVSRNAEVLAPTVVAAV